MKKLFPHILILLEILIPIFLFSGNSIRLIDEKIGLGLLILFPINSLLLLIIGIIKIKKHRSLGGGMILLGLIGLFFIFIISTGDQGHPKSERGSLIATLYSIMPQTQILYEQNNYSYEGICEDPVVIQGINYARQINAKDTPVLCFSDKDSFVIATKFKKEYPGGLNYYCIDSTGGGKDISESSYSTIVSADTLCH